MADVNFRLIAPDPDQLFGRSTQHLCIDITLSVARVRKENEARLLKQIVIALPIAAERSRKCNTAGEFAIHEMHNVVVACINKLAGQFTRPQNRHEQCRRYRHIFLGIGVERCFHRCRFIAVKTDNRQAIVRAPRLRPGLRDCDVCLTRQPQQHARAARNLNIGNFERFLPAVTCRDQNSQPGAVHRPLCRPRQIGRACFFAHCHAVRHFEIMAIIGCRLVAAQENTCRCNVGRRREGLGFRVTARRTL